MGRQVFVNNARTQLAADLAASATSLTVLSETDFPALTGDEFLVVTLTNANSDIEIIRVTGISGTVWTIVRGQEGTLSQTWVTGDTVGARLTAESLQRLQEPLKPYSELEYFNGDLVSVDTWDSSSKTTKLFSRTLTYSSGLLVKATISNELSGELVTIFLTYSSAGFLINSTKTVS